MPSLVNHCQHVNQVIGFNLVDNAVGLKAQFAHGIFVKLLYLMSLAG